ncbi:MAG: OmpA family protein [Panacibacter sp.]
MKNTSSNFIPLFILLFFVPLQSLFAQNSLVETIYFKPNSFSIDKKYKTILNEIVAKCKADTSFSLKIFAYADTKGSEAYNDEISRKRAMSVYNYLFSHVQFDTTKAYVTWLGESNDGYDLHYPEAHLQERCVDIQVEFYNRK